jgi:hypothetical protein
MGAVPLVLVLMARLVLVLAALMVTKGSLG